MGRVGIPKYSMGDGNLSELEIRKQGIKQMESSKGQRRWQKLWGISHSSEGHVRGSSWTFPGIVASVPVT